MSSSPEADRLVEARVDEQRCRLIELRWEMERTAAEIRQQLSNLGIPADWRPWTTA